MYNCLKLKVSMLWVSSNQITTENRSLIPHSDAIWHQLSITWCGFLIKKAFLDFNLPWWQFKLLNEYLWWLKINFRMYLTMIPNEKFVTLFKKIWRILEKKLIFVRHGGTETKSPAERPWWKLHSSNCSCGEKSLVGCLGNK